jgi:hypothetical protein
MFEKCAKYVRKVCNVCSKGVQSMFEKCAKYVRKVCKVCSKSVQGMFEKCAKYVRKVCKVCSASNSRRQLKIQRLKVTSSSVVDPAIGRS